MNRIVADAVNPERSFMRRQWNSVGMPLLRGILGTSEKYGSVISMGFRIVGTLQGLYAVQAIIGNVHEEVIKKLTLIDQDTLTMNLLLERHVGVEKEEARDISQELVSQQIDVTCIVQLCNVEEPRNACYKLKDRIGEYKETDKEVGRFLDSFLDKLIDTKESFKQTLDLIVKSVSDRMTDQIVVIVDSQLVSPWSTLVTSSLTDAISQRVQHYCLVDRNQNTDALNEDQKM